MAQVTKVELIDDLSGDKADETVTFSLDGVVFDIDLSANNAGILRDIFEDYVNAGRKVSKLAPASARRNTSVSTRQSRDQTAAIRRMGPQGRSYRLRPWPDLRDGDGRLPGGEPQSGGSGVTEDA